MFVHRSRQAYLRAFTKHMNLYYKHERVNLLNGLKNLITMITVNEKMGKKTH